MRTLAAFLLVMTAGASWGAVQIDTVTLPSGTTGSPYSATIQASGGTGPYAFTVPLGTVPPGLTLAGSGVWTGTPTVPGSFTFTVRATDVTNATGERQFTIFISNPLSITTTSPLPDARQSFPYEALLAAAGGRAPFSFSVQSGALPDGITVSNLSSPSRLEASSVTGAAGQYSFTMRVVDADNRSATKPFTLRVVDITPDAFAFPARTGVPFGATVTSDTVVPTGFDVPLDVFANNGLVSIGCSGAFSTMVTLSPGQGLCVRHVAAGNPGVTVETVVETGLDGVGVTFSTVFRSTTAALLSFATPAGLPDSAAGLPYQQALALTGGAAPFSFRLSAGALPPGIVLSAGGELSGSPTTLGSYSFEVTATDGSQQSAARSFTLRVNVDSAARAVPGLSAIALALLALSLAAAGVLSRRRR